MRAGAALIGAMAAFLAFVELAASEEKEPLAIIELGGVGEWPAPKGGAWSTGPSLGIEFSAIKDWLEIEASVSTLFRRGHTEYGTELLFRKPFPLTDRIEF